MGSTKASPLHWCVGLVRQRSHSLSDPVTWRTEPTGATPLPTGNCPASKRDALRDVPLPHEVSNPARGRQPG